MRSVNAPTPKTIVRAVTVRSSAKSNKQSTKTTDVVGRNRRSSTVRNAQVGQKSRRDDTEAGDVVGDRGDLQSPVSRVAARAKNAEEDSPWTANAPPAKRIVCTLAHRIMGGARTKTALLAERPPSSVDSRQESSSAGVGACTIDRREHSADRCHCQRAAAHALSSANDRRYLYPIWGRRGIRPVCSIEPPFEDNRHCRTVRIGRCMRRLRRRRGRRTPTQITDPTARLQLPNNGGGVMADHRPPCVQLLFSHGMSMMALGSGLTDHGRNRLTTNNLVTTSRQSRPRRHTHSDCQRAV
uniref:Uncharacterized protein n=1 Tax=Plectus sambesii TaxID=2011161 RepID=A0A914WR48_9BILA